MMTMMKKNKKFVLEGKAAAAAFSFKLYSIIWISFSEEGWYEQVS